MLRASRERPRSRRTDNSCNETARRIACPGAGNYRYSGLHWAELQQRFMIGETRFEGSILAEWMPALGEHCPKRLRLPASKSSHEHIGRIVPIPEVAGIEDFNQKM
jgi:hypothetical protein